MFPRLPQGHVLTAFLAVWSQQDVCGIKSQFVRISLTVGEPPWHGMQGFSDFVLKARGLFSKVRVLNSELFEMLRTNFVVETIHEKENSSQKFLESGKLMFAACFNKHVLRSESVLHTGNWVEAEAITTGGEG